MKVTASAPAKVILFGEHFVVYGEPAVVFAIDKRAQASVRRRADQRIHVNSFELGSVYFKGGINQTEISDQRACKELEPVRIVIQKVLDLSECETGVDVEIRSSIPIATGLGSSAAVAVAVTAAVSRLLDVELSREETVRIAHEAECFVHGTPSGIDTVISALGGGLLFSKDKGYKSLDVEGDTPFVIGNTGIERSTGKLVSMVRNRRKKHPSIINPIIRIGGTVALSAVEALKEGDFPTLGELMNVNHALLYAIGVSNNDLEMLVYAARKAGALGSKLTGAGGGGCMIALSLPNKVGKVVDAIRNAGGSAFIANKTDEGVKFEG